MSEEKVEGRADVEEEVVPKICLVLDGWVKKIGEWASWLNGILVIVIIVQVVLRYVFGRGLVSLEELEWHLYAVGIMLGLSYCLTTDSHIRLDIFHVNFSRRTKEVVEVLGILFLVLPFAFIVFAHSLDFVYESIRVNEHSDAPLGLPFRWIIKSFIPIGFGLLMVAGLSRAIRGVAYLVGARRRS
ncbi:MAG: TRAP transporter small permease subunit [Deltaproteobacteria bacterium]|nr:MAG: TRAP transporter small permease subunit [Deltaproteobacteria bacterium]